MLKHVTEVAYFSHPTRLEALITRTTVPRLWSCEAEFDSNSDHFNDVLLVLRKLPLGDWGTVLQEVRTIVTDYLTIQAG